MTAISPDPARLERDEFHDDLGDRRGLDPVLIKELTRLDPVRSTVSVVRTWLEVALLTALAVRFPEWWVVAPCMILLATRAQALFILAHEAVHYRLYETRWLNDLVGRLCATPGGISMFSYRVIHRLHHNHLFGRQDPDTPIHGGYPRGRAYLAGKLLRDVAGLTAWKTYAYFWGAPSAARIDGAKSDPLGDTSPKLRRDALNDRWAVAGFHLALPAAALAFGFFTEYLLLWAIPLWFLLQPLLRFRSILEHGMTTETGDVWHDARTNLGPGWLMWLIFPHHVHYHLEHHLYPSVPHYNLPRAHRALRENGQLEDAEVRPVESAARLAWASPAV